MSRFNCNDCCLNNTSACRYGANKSNDYSEYCPDLLVEQNVAYEKALDDCIKSMREESCWEYAIAFIKSCKKRKVKDE